MNQCEIVFHGFLYFTPSTVIYFCISLGKNNLPIFLICVCNIFPLCNTSSMPDVVHVLGTFCLLFNKLHNALGTH